MIATVVTPVSPKHKQSGIYHQAIESVKAQTISVAHIIEFDDSGKGAAHTRNKATAKVKTPFVIWLDADDLLRPTFIEDCLKVYKPGHYVYTDWVVKGMVINTPTRLNMWDIGQEHVITTLMPVSAWRDVDGFDETLDTLEDEDYHRKLHAFGWCGIRCAEPLIEYRREFGQSLVNKETVDKATQEWRLAEKQALFENRYRRFRDMAKDCGCGSSATKPIQPNGERKPNDVLAETLYNPQKVEGTVTGRLYPRSKMGHPMWVDEDDARSRPDRFRIIGHNPDKISPDIKTVKRLTEQAIKQETPERKIEMVNTTKGAYSAGGSGNFKQITVDLSNTPNLADLTRKELLALAEQRNIQVIGTGARGRVSKDDLLSALA